MSQRLLAGLAGIVGSIVEFKFTISVGDLWYRCLGNCGQIWPLSVTLILFVCRISRKSNVSLMFSCALLHLTERRPWSCVRLWKWYLHVLWWDEGTWKLMLQRIRMNCNHSTSDYDKAAEEEKKKKSVDFDCESGVHNRGMKSKW